MADTTSITSASDIQANYLQLLVTQLQNQDPLNPLDNQQMAAQLAQFSQLQQTENLNSSFSKVLDSVQRSYAGSLIGKQVSYATPAADGTTQTGAGQVQQVTIGSDGAILLAVDSQSVNLADVASIRD
jgi:flagellar basal-body rod modification protein FlgD